MWHGLWLGIRKLFFYCRGWAALRPSGWIPADTLIISADISAIFSVEKKETLIWQQPSSVAERMQMLRWLSWRSVSRCQWGNVNLYWLCVNFVQICDLCVTKKKKKGRQKRIYPTGWSGHLWGSPDTILDNPNADINQIQESSVWFTASSLILKWTKASSSDII